MLTLQAIILALAIPVMITVENVGTTKAVAVGGGLAVLCILTAGILRRPGAYVLGHLIQIASIAMGLLVPVMYFIGVMFAALWLGAYFLGRKIESDKAAWAAKASNGG